VLISLGLKRAEVSLLFVKDRAMRRWHRRLLNKTTLTDVISVSQRESRSRQKEPDPFGSLGDIIICTDQARRQAKKEGISAREELGRYVIHGILHCLGHRDYVPKEKKQMWTVQEKLLKRYQHILRGDRGKSS
jgi:probable rRNA maturation factor